MLIGGGISDGNGVVSDDVEGGISDGNGVVSDDWSMRCDWCS